VEDKLGKEKEKGKGKEMNEKASAPSLEERLKGLSLRGEEEEDLDFSA
jgi:hypothetical protein